MSAGTGRDRRPLLLGADDVAGVFDLDTALASQREAFSRLGRGEADQPARVMLPVPGTARWASATRPALRPAAVR